jgi:CHAD domain-containing protein
VTAPVLAKLHEERVKLQPLAEAIARGDEDPDALHDLRVGLRRMRTVARELADALDRDAGAALRDALRESAHATSRVRDLDVLLRALDAYVEALPVGYRAGAEPLRAALEARRHAARSALREDLRRHPPPPVRPELAGRENALDALLDARARRLARRVRRHGRAAGPGADAADLHTLRKDVKRYRYLLELFPDAWPKKARRRAVRDLRELQTLLGAFQDREVHRALLEAASLDEAAALSPRALLSAGMILLDLARAQDAARAALPAAFARYERRRRRRPLSLRRSP